MDNGNHLVRRNGLSLSDDPIVVGVDLTGRDSFGWHAIRHYLSYTFSYHVDPEVAVVPEAGGKTWIKPDDAHWFDYLFITDGTCELRFDASCSAALAEALSGN